MDSRRWTPRSIECHEALEEDARGKQIWKMRVYSRHHDSPTSDHLKRAGCKFFHYEEDSDLLPCCAHFTATQWRPIDGCTILAVSPPSQAAGEKVHSRATEDDGGGVL